MLKAIKIRLYPNNTAKGVLNGHLGTCRFVYNKLLATSIEQYKVDKTPFSQKYANELVLQWKKQEETKFITETYAQVLQQTIINLDKAFKNFFRRLKKGGEASGFPKFKKKTNHRDSCRFTNQKTKINGNRITFSKKLKNIKFSCSERDIKQLSSCKLMSATVVHAPNGAYYCSVCIDTLMDKPIKQTKTKSVGIDLGIGHFAVLSNGIKINNPKTLKRYEVKLAKEQKVLSRKTSGSHRRERQRLLVAKLHSKITNCRLDFLHKLSYELSNEFGLVCLEDLNVKGMVRNHKLAKSISDCGWSEFVRQLEYKCNSIAKVDRFFGSSKTCHCCGNVYKELSLRERSWECSSCGAVHDRDINAAINIEIECLRNLRLVG